MTQTVFCPNCNAPIRNGARFCEACGRPLAVAAMHAPAAAGNPGSAGKWLIGCGIATLAGVLVLACVAAVVILSSGGNWRGLLPGRIVNRTEQLEVLPSLAAKEGETTEPATKPTPKPTPKPTTKQPQPEVTNPAVEEQPNQLPEPTESPLKIVNFEGTAFEFDPALAAEVAPEKVKGTSNPDEAPLWELQPDHQVFRFQFYPLTGTFHEPQVIVYPVDEFKALDENVTTQIDALSQLLQTKPKNPEKELPLLPTWNAAQLFHASVKYLVFKNGEGVRYLTQYAQATSPANNHDLFYTFQGITKDHKNYISAIFPVNHPDLPADYNSAPEITDPGTYYQQIPKKISAYADDSFSPDLALLDALIRSLMVK